jgi:hypothetical protein
MWAILSQRTERSLSALHEEAFQAFHAILGVNAQPEGTKLSGPHFGTRPPPAVQSRRLSRIAKGPLTRCSERALARIAKGGGLIDGDRAASYATARQPGKPLSTISAITREAPLTSLFVAFLFGVAVARRL